MGLLNIYYRAFTDYRKNTENDKPSKRERKLLAKCNDTFEKFIVTKYKIEIEEDWIIEIEKGLEFIEKAVKEERQFIRTNGEIVPIEKVKKVSRDSVSHLARHSNMITHVPENPNDTIVPDSIFMVEKLNDYAVYENRFLYMLLCYLRDFLELRIQKITDIRMTYICDFEIKRNLNSKKRNMDFQTTYHESRSNNPYPIDNDESKALLTRINNCQQIVMMLLNTNLMTEVSKAPMVKPPIIKTNVLKMNNNFKNAVALYDYIVNYNKDGYTSTEVVTNFIPLNDIILDEFMELPTLTYFLTYEYGNELNDILKKEYLEEEENKRKNEEKLLLEQIKRLKKRILESGQGMEEYMLLLEKRNRMLEEDSQELKKAKIEINRLNKEIESLHLEIEELNNKILELQAVIEEKLREIAYLKQKYIDDMNALKKAHREEIEKINLEHQLEIDELNEKHENEIELINNNHQLEIEELKKNHEDDLKTQMDYYENKINETASIYENKINETTSIYEKKLNEIDDFYDDKINELKISYKYEIQNLKIEYESLINKNNDEILQLQNKQNELLTNHENERTLLNSEINQLNDEKKKLIDDYELKLHNLETNYLSQIEENNNIYNEKITSLDYSNSKAITERNLMAAELRAIRVKHELLTPSESYTSEERFTQLEEEFEAFNKFFKAQWNLTKKSIRKQLLWSKKEKKNEPLEDNGLSNSLDSLIEDEKIENDVSIDSDEKNDIDTE